jgi:elongation factor 3
MDVITKQLEAATTSKTKPERLAGADAFAAAVVKAGLPVAFHELKLTDLLTQNFKKEGKKGGPQREGALYCINALCKASAGASNFLIPCISDTFELQGDKLKPVATAAEEAAGAIVKGTDDNSIALLIPQLVKKVVATKGNVNRFNTMTELCTTAPQQMAIWLADTIPACVPFMNDLSKDVAKSALKCIKALCDTCTNPDMEPFIPSLVKCMKDQKEVPETVFKMASTTFVAEVDGSALSIMAPVLVKGLGTKSATQVKRQCSRIIENMAKLVDEPRFLATFLPAILPLLESAMVHISDPEARDVCAKAVAILVKKNKEAKPLAFDMKVSVEKINAAAGEAVKPTNETALSIAAHQACMLNEIAEYSAASWKKSIVPTLTNGAGIDAAKAEALVESVRVVAEGSRVEKQEEEVDDGAEVLCDLPFGLAYGNKVLLRKTKLKLLRGHKYGLLGQNDSGKTSLLQALADYKIDGFPTAEECRTVFVATDIKTELADFSVIDYMFNDPLLKDCGVSKEDMGKMLNGMGFKEGAPANTTQPVGTLSGGWRMKLALSRAMLLKADILLLDEPTNHLDAYNVKWVETYLNSLTNVTCIMVSHDSGLLTRVCNNIIEINEMKLNYYRGNLETFVEANPHAKAYFELAKEGKINFNFPQPGPLPGITSKGKAIMKMTNISFTYPNPDGTYTGKKPQLNNVTVQISLSSRVACVGENGAGKSTMIKLLTGELEPDKGSGDVWKHPNCRVGYIAQHAFHHIEKHLDETANDYIRWRYANGGDREATVKVTSICTAEEIKKQEAKFEVPFPQEDGTITKSKLTVERFTERRKEEKKDKKTYYECVFTTITGNHWVERDLLCKNGWEKVLNLMDERIAMRATQFQRPLTKENVQKHIKDVGLDPEFSTHMRMGALSGGQKVKVVLASALWTQPHVLILDEPTNYLDRESLGALARAIRAFEGGVVMITHNSQFCDNLCPVVWHLQNNTLDVKGDAEWMAEAARQKIVVATVDDADMVDKFGNTVDIKKNKPKTKKQLKLKKQRRLKRFKETGDDYDSSEEDAI